MIGSAGDRQVSLFAPFTLRTGPAYVVNIHRIRKITPHYDVYVGDRVRFSPHATIDGEPFRASIFRNHYKERKDGDRHEVCEKYRLWLMGEYETDRDQERRAATLYILPFLRGCVLGCWCRPLECHGDTLAALINGELPYPVDWPDLQKEYPAEYIFEKYFRGVPCGTIGGVFR